MPKQKIEIMIDQDDIEIMQKIVKAEQSTISALARRYIRDGLEYRVSREELLEFARRDKSCEQLYKKQEQLAKKTK